MNQDIIKAKESTLANLDEWDATDKKTLIPIFKVIVKELHVFLESI